MKASVILYKQKKLANDEFPLMLRLSDGGQRKLKSIGISLPEKYWNFKAQELRKVKGFDNYSKIKSKIDELLSKYSKAIDALDRPVSMDTLIKKVENPIIDITVLTYFKRVAEDMKKAKEIGNAQAYITAMNSLRAFTGGDIKFQEIDVPFLKKYETWIKSKDSKVKSTSISVYFRTLRALYNRAIEDGYASQEKYPFGKKFSIAKKFNTKTRKRAIGFDEIAKVKALDLKPGTPEFDARMYFLFSYYASGINFTDIARLKWSDIKNNALYYNRTKTHEPMETALHDYNLSILDSLRTITGIDPDNYIFPILNKHIHITEMQVHNRIRKVITQVNRSLKKVGRMAKIQEPLTTYVARHSAITNQIRLGGDIDTIQKAVGHSDINTTMIYVKQVAAEQSAAFIKEMP